MNAEAGAELLAIGDAVGERVLEIAAQVVVRLHGDDVGAVGHEEQILGGLQVMGAGVIAAGEKRDRLETPRVSGIEHRHAVAEHVADVQVTPVHHDLDAVGSAADVAVGEMPDAASDACWWNRHVDGEGDRARATICPRRVLR